MGEKSDNEFLRKNFINVWGIKKPETEYNFEKNRLGEEKREIVPKLASKMAKIAKNRHFFRFCWAHFSKKNGQKMVPKKMNQN